VSRSPVRPSPRRSLVLALVASAAVVLAACSSSSPPAASGSGSAPSAGAPTAAAQAVASVAAASAGAADCVGAGVTFCGHIAIRGGVTRDADFVSGVFSPTCADWLKGNKDDATRLTLPIAMVADINTDTVIQSYTGPGVYDVADLAGNLGGFQVVVGHDRFVADGTTTGTATLTGEGSGSVAVTGMQPAGDANTVQQPIDLTLTWTCYTK
jgi:hypothetical protein